ncbi:hypothetical protein HD806DRAFT_166580 [Xylariaceae sp. AK1471]|nr:hypothetical protein HD806DRAFT_166580 [Xylariaceae sp. AK1471]
MKLYWARLTKPTRCTIFLVALPDSFCWITRGPSWLLKENGPIVNIHNTLIRVHKILEKQDQVYLPQPPLDT